ncbi:SIS domain-containing protein [Cellulomonas sp. P24]|uniref:SIS domain-containing protein n=1 Tax=Cellulomonas sp. P24 TaxID=2885206 RepID=UPI00216B1425|nr:SIS domain-containing protein [Cellulomonas sp. P24]MCR6493642.1 SIS domain-containing protein [Cellulomonas sp. P24]
MTTQMAREIREQPAAVALTISSLLASAGSIRRLVAERRHVLLIGRGTSDNAAVYGQYVLSTRGRLATLASPSIATAYHSDLDLGDVVAVGLSQSGTTSEIVETLEWAARCGARTVAVTNEPESDLAAVADLALVTRAGREVAVPATKTYTSQLAAMAVLGLVLAEDTEMLDQLERVPDQMARALDSAPLMEQLAGQLVGADRFVVAARGYALSVARELALKLQEACYVTAVGLSWADLLHGPIAMVGEGTPTALIASTGDAAVFPGTAEVARRCARAGADVIAFGGDAELAAECRVSVAGPDADAMLAPMSLVVPGQLLVEALARAKGIDPDAPRGLRKITQTA